MVSDSFLLPFFLFMLVATLYSSIGHAGASGYLAVMALLSFAPETIKPTSLVLNIFVAFIASVRYIRADYFDKSIFIPVIITSVPMAFLGGYLSIDPFYFRLLAGAFLIVSSILLLSKTYIRPQGEPRKMPLYAGVILGAAIGLFSGLIGVGGGIFLSPIIILANWTTVKKASGVAALFIFFNSIMGLAGHISAFNQVNFDIAYWILAVVIGGFLGSYLGTRAFNNKVIIAFLFVVLLSAGLKFVLVGG